MKLWKNIKTGFKKGSTKVTNVTEDLVEKGKEAGFEGLVTTKEMIANIGDKASEVKDMVRHKYEINSLNKSLGVEYSKLGKLMLESYKGQQSEMDDESFKDQTKMMLDLDMEIQVKTREYDRLRKQYSQDYIVNKLSDDLASSNSVIDQIYISPKSNVVDKLLKDILLPKEALISAIKRGNDMIIPDGNTMLKANDTVIVLGKEEDVQKVKKRFSAGGR
jgi:K+/H+ antiporter YhaU regulatory subunit KhtT